MMAQGREPSAEAKQAHRNAAYTARLKPKTNAANTKILAFDRPIIAAVNGAAVGWGMDLACLCDIIIASDQARFASLFVKRGLCPDLGGLNRLPQIVGPQVAAELLFTGCGTWQRGGHAFLVSFILKAFQKTPCIVCQDRLGTKHHEVLRKTRHLCRRMIDASTALDYGLVSRVVPAEALLETAQELAHEIAANPPLSLRKIKEGLRYDTR